MRRSTRGTAAVAVFAAAVLTLAGCAGSDASRDTPADGTPRVVASTDVWGSVAAAVAGDRAEVVSLYNSPDGDPHEFEPSAADTATVADADVIVFNGGHYDAYMEQAAETNDSAIVVNAAEIAGLDTGHGHDHGEEGHDHEGHDHGHDHENEHLFYDLPVVAQVARAIADALEVKAPDTAPDFAEDAASFEARLNELRGRLADLHQRYRGTKVAQTEPLAGYLLQAAGLDDVAPTDFTAAVEEGQSPSAAARAAMEDLLRDGTARVLIYNAQAVDPVTESLLGVARQAGVPVVTMTESLPEGVDDYIDWQSAQIDALTAALAR